MCSYWLAQFSKYKKACIKLCLRGEESKILSYICFNLEFVLWIMFGHTETINFAVKAELLVKSTFLIESTRGWQRWSS